MAALVDQITPIPLSISRSSKQRKFSAMASKTSAETHLLFSLNLLCFILSAASAADNISVTVTNPINGGGSVTVTTPDISGSVTFPGGSVNVTAPGSGGSVTDPGNGGSMTVTTPDIGGSVTFPGGSVNVTAPGSGGSVTDPGNGGSMTMRTPGGSGGGSGKCPRDAVKLGVCANVLGDLVKVKVGEAPTAECCTVLAGLVDLEAAVCLCTVVRATVVGMNLSAPLNLMLDLCGRPLPTGFTC